MRKGVRAKDDLVAEWKERRVLVFCSMASGQCELDGCLGSALKD